MPEDKLCIHKYLTKCLTNPQPPGFADFLRGTIALYNFSQKHGYKLLFDNEHPLYKFIKPNENIISTDSSSDVIEILPPLDYDTLYHKLNNIFSDNKSFKVMTNSFYNLNNIGKAYNWGGISEHCRGYLRQIFCPSVELDNKIEHVIKSVYGIKTGETFKIIHVRFGDKFIHNNTYDDSLYNLYYNKISNIINKNKNNKYVLISDSSIMANKLKINIPNLYYWDNKKIHMGDLINNTESTLLDTLTDFFIMTKSNEIISNGSGFSTCVSIIYNIKYITI
jgi:ASC-1-like (ASCH) protein